MPSNPPSGPGTGTPSSPHEPITAVCAATYAADLVPAYAFVFRVPSTGTRFTVYSADLDRYLINGTYILTIAEPDAVPLWLSADEWAFLRHCLDTLGQRWREAIAEADAGVQQPPRDRVAPPGHRGVEPTPTGYRAIGRAFRDELDRVRQLRQRVDQLLAATPPGQDGDQP